MPRRRSRATPARRFVLRFCGEGPAPRADVALLEAEITVVEFSPPRLMLVRASARRLHAVLERMPGWAVSEERAVPLPTRPKRRPKAPP